MYRDVVTPAVLADLGLNPSTAKRLYDEHLRRRADHNEVLWALLVLCHWKSRA